MTVLSNLQNVLQQQLSEIKKVSPTDENYTKVVARITRIINGLIDASSAFENTDATFKESVEKLGTTVDVLKGVVNVVKNADVNDEKTLNALRIVLQGLHKSVIQFQGTRVSKDGESDLEGLEAEIDNLGYSIDNLDDTVGRLQDPVVRSIDTILRMDKTIGELVETVHTLGVIEKVVKGLEESVIRWTGCKDNRKRSSDGWVCDDNGGISPEH